METRRTPHEKLFFNSPTGFLNARRSPPCQPATPQEEQASEACYDQVYGSGAEVFFLKSGFVTGPIYYGKYKDCLRAKGYAPAQ